MSDKTPLGREAILAFKSQKKIKTVETESLGPVRVQELSYAAGKGLLKYAEDGKFDVAYFIASVVDESGQPMFTLCDEDFASLSELPLNTINEVVTAAVKLNKVAVEQEAKN